MPRVSAPAAQVVAAQAVAAQAAVPPMSLDGVRHFVEALAQSNPNAAV